jgi:hypothetical protein
MDRARALAEGRPVDDRPRRKAARKAASVAKKVTGVGKKQTAPAAPGQSAPAAPEQSAPAAPEQPAPAATEEVSAEQATTDVPADTSATGPSDPASVTEAGETPATDVTAATTESAPPQSGPMVADQLAGEDAPEAADEAPRAEADGRCPSPARGRGRRAADR